MEKRGSLHIVSMSSHPHFLRSRLSNKLIALSQREIAMFTEKTVLVLGAGASAGYGFPTGETLRNDIISGIRTDPIAYIPHFSLGFGNPSPTELQKVTDFASALLESGQGSIDAFLRRQKGNESFRKIGKFAIAKELIPKEQAALAETHNEWYTQLWQFLDSEASWDRISDNQLAIILTGAGYIDRSRCPVAAGDGIGPRSGVQRTMLLVVTYNYDRSLEHYLHTALTTSYDGQATRQECEEILRGP